MGLSGREAARRLVVYGPNELTRRGGRRWPRELLAQFTHPLALLLVVAAVLALGGRHPGPRRRDRRRDPAQRRRSRSCRSSRPNGPSRRWPRSCRRRARCCATGGRSEIEARDLVPGDVLVVAEGDRVCADARIIDGASRWTCPR